MLTTSQEEAPGLYDILHPLFAGWKLLVLGVLAGLLVAAVITFILPKEYSTSFVLKIGSVADKQLEDPYSVVEVINSESFLESAAGKAGVKRTGRQAVKATTDQESWQPRAWVQVQVSAENPDTAVRLANAIATGILQRHTDQFNRSMQPYKTFETDLQTKIQLFEAEGERLQKNLQDYRSIQGRSASDEILLQTKLADHENQTLALKKELHTLETSMSEVHSINTEVAAPPNRPAQPSKPNLKMNLIVAFIASLFLMISFVLLADQYKKGSLRL